MSGRLSQRIEMFLCLISDQCVINTPSSTVMLLSFDGSIFPKYSTLLLSRPGLKHQASLILHEAHIITRQEV